MDNLAFLDELSDYGSSKATLKVVLPDGEVLFVSDRICPYKFLDACPLLYHAFEHGFRGHLQASIEAPSRSAVVSLLRYCYTGAYLSANVEYSPVLLLQHAEVYKLAEDFDVPELQLVAHGNFSCRIDYACSLPAPPQDLLDTIRFIYHHYADYHSRQEHGLMNNLTNYCISNFFYHKLGANAEFLQVVSDFPAFRQDLCRTNMARNFEDDCAFEIIRLSLDTLKVDSGYHHGWVPTILASRDLPQEMLFDIPSTKLHEASNDSASDAMAVLKDESCSSHSKTTKDVEDSHSISTSTATTLVNRPRKSTTDQTPHFETDSSSGEEGFSLVHRPKVVACATPDEPMSSPELVPSAPIDVSAATGSDYLSDDEWTMV